MSQEDKWYKKALIYMLIAVFSPLILISLIIYGIVSWFKSPALKKEYKKSRYYSDVKRKYSSSVTSSPEYRFYNSAVRRGLPIEYHRQESNGLEFFIYDGTLFFFPDFYEIEYDKEKGEWTVGWYSDETKTVSAYMQSLMAKLDVDEKIPARILCERRLFGITNLREEQLPEEVYLTSGYEYVFDANDFPLDIIIPQTTRELYNMMIQNPDLCGSYEMTADEDDYGSIFWTLGETCLELCVGHGQGYINVIAGGSLHGKSITHWHPDPDEIYDEVTKIGKRGNVTVVCSSRGAGTLLYSGEKTGCPYLPPRKRLLWKYYYFEAE